jgi:hypothetical protein
MKMACSNVRARKLESKLLQRELSVTSQMIEYDAEEWLEKPV